MFNKEKLKQMTPVVLYSDISQQESLENLMQSLA